MMCSYYWGLEHHHQQDLIIPHRCGVRLKEIYYNCYSYAYVDFYNSTFLLILIVFHPYMDNKHKIALMPNLVLGSASGAYIPLPIEYYVFRPIIFQHPKVT